MRKRGGHRKSSAFSFLRAFRLLRALVQSNEAEAAEFNGAFVAMQYYGYLRRTPEEGGYSGLQLDESSLCPLCVLCDSVVI
jgi:hypothetical protein